jgi:hypothetical protein
MSAELETVPTAEITPLSIGEKIRLGQLERQVETNLTGFLKCGMALKEIHEARLWRAQYSSFAEYAKLRFGLCHSTANQLVRSCAIDRCAWNETPISATVPEIVLRPLTTLPNPDLQAQTWRLAASVSPDKKPTRTIAARVTRLVKEAIGAKPKKNGHLPDAEPMFVRPIQRLARIDTFRADLAVSHVDSPAQATRIIAACRLVADRCHQIQTQLEAKFA